MVEAGSCEVAPADVDRGIEEDSIGAWQEDGPGVWQPGQKDGEDLLRHS